MGFEAALHRYVHKRLNVHMCVKVLVCLCVRVTHKLCALVIALIERCQLEAEKVKANKDKPCAKLSLEDIKR